ncbi:hypothetical protein [Yoonia vestfoldensis]|uniref:hypothetical protein n=1 Tax=Yoonia vestfoldensis TaxID=245188 RepID=UPI0013A54944|nr:hypothetical protein [Yoonia vestfoldensis]
MPTWIEQALSIGSIGQISHIKLLCRLGLVFGALSLAGPAAAYDGEGETPPPDYYCHKEERYLTDDEFLEQAFQFEVRTRQLPDPFRSMGIEGLRALNPDCCFVEREDYELNQDHQTFWRRLLWREIVSVGISWSSEADTPWLERPRTYYHMSTCGVVESYTGTFIER